MACHFSNGHPTCIRLFVKICLPIIGRGHKTKTVLHSWKAVEKHIHASRATERDYLQNLMPEQIAEVESQKIQLAPLLDSPEDDDTSNWQDIAGLNGILCGDEVLEISHKGGEYEMARDLCERLTAKWQKQRGHRRDFKKCRNWTQQQINAFQTLLEPMTSAYMDWATICDTNKAPMIAEGPASAEGTTILDVFRQYSMQETKPSVDDWVHNGAIPCAPK
ncbi:hypothetical protein EDD18DRAFT_1356940 [Armillaria luteobubalina]|uniref:Uncharacterized protein n=1 Tax=Armillaria luteobubalina TaxID=153913 RepID=A0AA39PYS6_9AGAR|nr:hypothetical protein EDD18DRAFT_1356940 [Armillaria luteobubalina]